MQFTLNGMSFKITSDEAEKKKKNKIKQNEKDQKN
jgi:hypothetical protein